MKRGRDQTTSEPPAMGGAESLPVSKQKLTEAAKQSVSILAASDFA